MVMIMATVPSCISTLPCHNGQDMSDLCIYKVRLLFSRFDKHCLMNCWAYWGCNEKFMVVTPDPTVYWVIDELLGSYKSFVYWQVSGLQKPRNTMYKLTYFW